MSKTNVTKKYSNVKKPKNKKELRVCLQLIMAQKNES